MNYKNKLFMTKKKAFTLIELLIVIAIIGILFIVLVSKVDFATDKAKATGVQTDFRSFQVAIESVAKEHAGLATFGWDTGDANGNRIRDSYDKGDTNQNGKQDPGEVFVGSKTYGETWANVYTLTNPADANDQSAIIALEAAINKNLDPKLHITIHDDYTITMANGAQDPWNTEYHGYYITNATVDGKDRGAIVIYSNGANQEFGSEHSIAGGVVSINVPGNNVYGKDDYGMSVIYTYVNGYGEVKTTTSGFSSSPTVNTTLNNEKQHANGLYFNRRYISEQDGTCAYVVFFKDGTGAMEMVGSRTPEVKFAYPLSVIGIQSIEYTETSIVMSAPDLNQVVEVVVADDGQRLIIDGMDFAYLSDYYYYHYEGNSLSPDGFVYDKPYTMYYFDMTNTRFISYIILRQSGLWEVYYDYYDGNGPVLHATGAANEVISSRPIDSYDNGNYLVIHNNSGDDFYLMLEESIPFK